MTEKTPHVIYKTPHDKRGTLEFIQQAMTEMAELANDIMASKGPHKAKKEAMAILAKYSARYLVILKILESLPDEEFSKKYVPLTDKVEPLMQEWTRLSIECFYAVQEIVKDFYPLKREISTEIPVLYPVS